MGGFGVVRAAAESPLYYAAIVPIAGGGNMADAEALARIPIWAFHGAKDGVVPPSSMEPLIEAISKLGGKPKFSVIPDGDHWICHAVCKNEDLWKWLLEQKLTN